MSAHLCHRYRQQRALPPPIWRAREHFYPSSPIPSRSSATAGDLSYLAMIILHIRLNLQGKTLVKVVVRRSLIPHTKSPKGFSPHHIRLLLENIPNVWNANLLPGACFKVRGIFNYRFFCIYFLGFLKHWLYQSERRGCFSWHRWLHSNQREKQLEIKDKAVTN